MNEELVKAVTKALEKNHKNGPITAKNLVNIYKDIISSNQQMTADQIASLINDADEKSNSEDENDD